MAADLKLQLYSPFSSHVIRSALLLLSGRPFPPQESASSKKSANWKRRQGSMKSFVAPQGKGKEREREGKRHPPPTFRDVCDELVQGIREVFLSGEETKKAAVDEVASVVLGVSERARL
jgi:hypothetical protein